MLFWIPEFLNFNLGYHILLSILLWMNSWMNEKIYPWQSTTYIFLHYFYLFCFERHIIYTYSLFLFGMIWKAFSLDDIFANKSIYIYINLIPIPIPDISPERGKHLLIMIHDLFPHRGFDPKCSPLNGPLCHRCAPTCLQTESNLAQTLQPRP